MHLLRSEISPRREKNKLWNYCPMSSNKSFKTHCIILQAARDIVRTEGIDHLSMDRVAQRAAVSKGAVMYHFPSKRALQAALLQDYAEHMTLEQRRHEALFEGSPLETLIPGYVEWFKSFAADNRGWSAVGVQLLGQQAKNPELLKPVSDWYDALYARLEKLPAKQRARMLMAVMTLEGLFFVKKFGLGHMDEKHCREILNLILELTGSSTVSRAQEKQAPQ